MFRKEKHEMILTHTDVTGQETWRCRQCSREILLKWNPEFQRTVISDGDSSVSHAGSKSEGVNLSISAGAKQGQAPPDWWPEDWR